MRTLRNFLRVLAYVTGITALSLSVQNLGAAPKLFSFPEHNFIRVAVLRDVPHVDISIRGIYQVVDPRSGEILREGRRLKAAHLVSDASGIVMDGDHLKFRQIRFLSTMDVSISMKGYDKRYRGATDIIQDAAGHLTVVNRVDLEDYIKGVLQHEASHRWPMEALKAQAVASRSYAMYQIKASSTKDFDVTSDIYSQVYGGKTGERYRTNLAVEYTRREVLVYQGKILPAYFHATCGGYTEDASELWNYNDMAPLKSVRCGFCLHSPHYLWKQNFRSKDVQDKLNAAGLKIGLIQDIAITERNRSGRIKNLQITDRQGKVLTISGKDFRNIVGPNDIRSNNYRIEMKGYFFDLTGKGWGHGVGLCQWGAYGMAMQRYDYHQILEFYYPGARLVDFRDL